MSKSVVVDECLLCTADGAVVKTIDAGMVFRIVAVVDAGTGRPNAGDCSTREYGILGSAYCSDGSVGAPTDPSV